MAFLTLQIAWELNLGIGVDVHIHRITNLLGWHKPLTKNPEQTRFVFSLFHLTKIYKIEYLRS